MTPKSQAVRNGLQKWPPKSPVVMDGLNKVYVSSNSCSPKDGLARMPLPKSDFDSVYHVKSSSQGLSTIDGTRMKSVVNTEKTRNNGTAESNVFKGEGTTTANFSNKGSVTRTTATEETNMFMTAAKKVATSLQAFVTTADASNTHTSKPQISDTHANKPASTSQCRVSRLRQTSAVVAHKANSLKQSTYPKSPFIKKSVTFNPSRITHVSFSDMESGGVDRQTMSRNPRSGNCITVTSSRSLREPGMSVRRRYRRSASSASASIRSGCTSHASSSSPLPNRALHSSTVPRLGRSVSACGDVPSAANYDSKPADSCVATLAVDSDALSLTVARDPAQDPDSCAISSDTKSPGIWESPGSAYRLHEHTSTPVCAATRGASPRSSVAWDYSAERVSDSSSPAASPTLAHKPKWKDLAEMMRRIRMDPQKVSEVESSRYCGAFGDKGEDGGSSSSERLVKIVLSSVCYELPLRSDLPVRKVIYM
ncbi:hypothetical protein ACOMHN_035114 [Nucella lapillus]